jgi:integration host factor subunit beta
MKRTDLVAAVARHNPDLPSGVVERSVSHVFDTIVDRLADRGRVELRGFGVFKTKARRARVSRDPKTGNPVDVTAKHVPFFRPGKDMHKRLNVE